MTQSQRNKKVDQSMARSVVIHEAAKKILAVLAEAELAYKAAGGNWEDDDCESTVFELLSAD